MKIHKKKSTDELLVQPSREPTWRQALDHLEANVFVADEQFILMYANPHAIATMRTIQQDIQSVFGVSIDDIVGQSIHQFHREPQRVERILRDRGSLPHATEFTFGKVTLSAKINRISLEDAGTFGYIVMWENVSQRIKIEGEMTRLANMVENLPMNVIFADRDCNIQYMNPASARTLKKTGSTSSYQD